MDNLSHCCSHEEAPSLTSMLPTVRKIASALCRRLPKHVPLDDLVSYGVLGLIQAIRRFDPAKGCQFQTYATFRIRGAIVDGLREMDWASRRLRRWAREICIAREELSQTHMREPSERELATELGLELDEFHRLQRELNDLKRDWLYPAGESDSEAPTDLDSVPDPSQKDPDLRILRSELMKVVEDEMKRLSPTEQRVLKLYYFDECTMKHVGAALGVGESRVSQIHARAISQLRRLLSQRCEDLIAAPEHNSPEHQKTAAGNFSTGQSLGLRE